MNEDESIYLGITLGDAGYFASVDPQPKPRTLWPRRWTAEELREAFVSGSARELRELHSKVVRLPPTDPTG